MSEYFIDTEFHEYKKKPLFSKGIDTIELISIGIVSDNNREYYAICKDFDLKAAWNNEWLRDNVLLSVFKDLNQVNNIIESYPYHFELSFTYKNFKNLLLKLGKTKRQIASEVIEFVGVCQGSWHVESCDKNCSSNEFYGYYSDYDWVVFCWLFGRMIDLPKGFPMFCIDLKQLLDEKATTYFENNKGVNQSDSLEKKLDFIKKFDNYPKQTNEHNALADARWNKQLYNFLNKL